MIYFTGNYSYSLLTQVLFLCIINFKDMTKRNAVLANLTIGDKFTYFIKDQESEIHEVTGETVKAKQLGAFIEPAKKQVTNTGTGHVKMFSLTRKIKWIVS